MIIINIVHSIPISQIIHLCFWYDFGHHRISGHHYGHFGRYQPLWPPLRPLWPLRPPLWPIRPPSTISATTLAKSRKTPTTTGQLPRRRWLRTHKNAGSNHYGRGRRIVDDHAVLVVKFDATATTIPTTRDDEKFQPNHHDDGNEKKPPKRRQLHQIMTTKDIMSSSKI